MTTLAAYRASIHRLLADGDLSGAFDAAGVSAPQRAPVVRSRAFKASRAMRQNAKKDKIAKGDKISPPEDAPVERRK